LLFVLALALRLYAIDQQLWLDEIAALINSMRRPLAEIVTRWPGTASHVLYDILAHVSASVLGESPFALRLPAALFGASGVVALYVLARRLFGATGGFGVALLMAVSYHHIFYSQDARGYTGFVFFFLVASALLVIFAEEQQITRCAGIGYAVAGALAGYTVLFGAFIVPAQMIVVVGMMLGARRRGAPLHFPWRAYATYALGSIALTALLYLPFVPSLVRFTREYRQLAAGVATAVGASAPAQAQMSRVVGLAFEALHGLAGALGGWPGLVVALAVTAVGFGFWLRRHPISLAILLAPLPVEGVALLALRVPIDPRFFAIALPIVLCAAGYGLLVIVERVTATMPSAFSNAKATAKLQNTVYVMAALLMAAALPRYYRTPKQDNLGAIAAVRSAVAAGAQPVAVHYADRSINRFYHAGYRDVESLQDLEAIEENDRPTVVITTLERYLRLLEPELYVHIQREYQLTRVLPGTVYDADMRIYLRRSVPQTSAGGAHAS
jgi:uncharacterized membrane protein